eukprot:45467-Eustigmatos_ZCMA.PRE.1
MEAPGAGMTLKGLRAQRDSSSSFKQCLVATNKPSVVSMSHSRGHLLGDDLPTSPPVVSGTTRSCEEVGALSFGRHEPACPLFH